jgi:excisionase family DNA binding protein
MSTRLEAALHELAEALRDEVRADAVSPDAPDRLLSVDEAAALLGIGRSMLYELVAAQRIRSIKVGRRRLIPSGAIADFAASR